MIHIVYLLVGMAAGLLAGLLGIGGGIVVVPVLDKLLAYEHFPAAISMHVAVGTSLAIMIFTAISSAYAYYRRDFILWPLFYRFTPGLLAGAVAGSLFAKRLPSYTLRIAFAIFLLMVAVHLFFQRQPQIQQQLPSRITLFFVSVLVGMLSGFFGVGGGMMMVPFFIFSNIETLKATGTSAACGIPLAVIGTIMYMITGLGSISTYNVPVGVIGYVYWPAALLVAIASIIFAPLGTRLAVSMPNLFLKRIFAIILFISAIDLFME